MMNIFRTQSSEPAVDHQVLYSKQKPTEQKRSRREKQLSSSSTLKTVDSSTHMDIDDDGSGFWAVSGEDSLEDEIQFELLSQTDVPSPSSVPQFRSKWTRSPRANHIVTPPSSPASWAPKSSSAETFQLPSLPSGTSCIWIDDKSDEERIVDELEEQIEVLTLSTQYGTGIRKKRSRRRSFASLFGSNSFEY